MRAGLASKMDALRYTPVPQHSRLIGALMLLPPQPSHLVQHLKITHDGFVAAMIQHSDRATLLKCWRLRHDYFVRQRQWVTPDKSDAELECDEYDEQAQHLAVFQEEQVVGYLRVIERGASCGFMIDHHFRHLVAEENWPLIQQADSIEISRLVISKDSLPGEAKIIFLLLFKLLYQLSLQRDYQHYLIVVEPHWLPLFGRRFGLDFLPIGPVTPFPDGTLTVAAQAAVTGLENVLFHKNPTLLAWFQTPQK